jgi:hypothetical protein
MRGQFAIIRLIGTYHAALHNYGLFPISLARQLNCCHHTPTASRTGGIHAYHHLQKGTIKDTVEQCMFSSCPRFAKQLAAHH